MADVFPARIALLATALVALVVPPAHAASRQELIARDADSLSPQLIAQRRDFHMNPELSNREERTARVIADRLRALGFDAVQTGVGRHGVVGLLKGAQPGPVVAVRADMDALPIQETKETPYKSRTDGVMHACGHDVHMAVLLGVAEVLSRHRELIHGTIKFVFQPAEEGAPLGEQGGARLMIEEGVLENPRPAAIFGLHTMPSIESGQLGVHSGAAMASSDRFIITIRGKKTHGAQPQLGVDAIVVASEAVSALQTIRSRRIDTLEPLVVTVGTIQGGDRYNILAEEVRMEGTLRSHNEAVRNDAKDLMRTTLAGITAAYGATFDLQFSSGNGVTYNDPALVEATLPTMRRIVGESNVVFPKPLMPAEDFSAYQKVIPGFFYFLGVGNRAKGINAPWHTADFDIDETSLTVGVNVMANVLLDYLDRTAAENQKERRGQ